MGQPVRGVFLVWVQREDKDEMFMKKIVILSLERRTFSLTFYFC